MAAQTKQTKAIIAAKDVVRDREDSDPPKARIEKRGYGGMDTKNKAAKADKEGI